MKIKCGISLNKKEGSEVVLSGMLEINDPEKIKWYKSIPDDQKDDWLFEQAGEWMWDNMDLKYELVEE